MDSVEVAVRLTEAIMARSGKLRKGEDPVKTYVEMFTNVLTRVHAVMNPRPAGPPPRTPRATSEVFPQGQGRRE